MHESLDPRWVRYRREVGWVDSVTTAALLAGAATVAVLLAGLPAVPVAIVAAVLAIARTVLSQWWPPVAYRHASYRLSADALEIRRGVLWRSAIHVPRTRIQHSDVSQGPLERRHGLGTLGVYTAGTAHSLVQLGGLDHERALEIRAHLMQTDADDVI